METTFSEVEGHRVLHYYLLSTSKDPLLAVVANEKNDRHFRYMISEDYIKVFGSTDKINVHTSWTSRVPVKEWLTSLVRRDNLPAANSGITPAST